MGVTFVNVVKENELPFDPSGMDFKAMCPHSQAHRMKSTNEITKSHMK